MKSLITPIVREIFKRQEGLTLIEMMVAAVIFAVGILGIIAMQGTILIGNDFSGNQTLAKSLAIERLDNLMFANYPTLLDCAVANSFCYRDIDLGGTFPSPSSATTMTVHAPLDATGTVSVQGRFVREWDIQPAPAPYTLTGKLIQVRVLWQDLQVAGKAQGAPSRTLVYSSVRMQP